MKAALAALLLATAVSGCAAPVTVSAPEDKALENYFLKLVEVNFAPGFDLDAWPLLAGEGIREREARVAAGLAEAVAGRVRQELAGEMPGYLLVVLRQVQVSAEAEGNSGTVAGSLSGEVLFFDIEDELRIAHIPVSVRQREHYLRTAPLLSASGKLADEVMNDALAGLLASFAERVQARLE